MQSGCLCCVLSDGLLYVCSGGQGALQAGLTRVWAIGGAMPCVRHG